MHSFLLSTTFEMTRFPVSAAVVATFERFIQSRVKENRVVTGKLR